MIGFPKTFTDFSKNKLNFPIKKDWQSFIKKQAEWYLENQDFHSEKKEDWKYFPIQKVLNQNFAFNSEQTSTTHKTEKPYLPSSLPLFIHNGRLVPSFKQTQEFSLFSWKDFLNSKINLDAKIQSKILSVLKTQRDPFCSLNNALFEDGLILIVKTSLTQPLEIHYTHDFSDKATGLNLRNFIFIEENSSAQIIEFFHKQEDNESLFLNMQTDIFLSEKAQLEHCRIDQMSEKDTMINQLFANLSQSAKMNLFSLSLKSGLTGWRSFLEQEEKSNSEVRGLSLLKGHCLADHKVSIRHKGIEGESHQLFKSFLFDSAKQIFQGFTAIEQKAQKSNISQLSKNFLFGKRAFSVALPQLDVVADDVKAVHGAVVSSFQENKDLIFYLQSRGLDFSSAFHLVLSGQVQSTLSCLQPNTKALIQSLLEKQLNTLEESIKQISLYQR